MGTLFANSRLKAVSTLVKCESGNQVCTCMASFSETHPCMYLRLYKSYQSFMYEYFCSCFYTAFNSVDTEFWSSQGFRVGEFTDVMDQIIKNSCFFSAACNSLSLAFNWCHDSLNLCVGTSWLTFTPCRKPPFKRKGLCSTGITDIGAGAMDAASSFSLFLNRLIDSWCKKIRSEKKEKRLFQVFNVCFGIKYVWMSNKMKKEGE